MRRRCTSTVSCPFFVVGRAELRPLMQIPDLVQHRDRVGDTRVIDDEAAQLAGDPVRMPGRAAPQMLHPPRPSLAGPLAQHLPVLRPSGPAGPAPSIPTGSATPAGGRADRHVPAGYRRSRTLERPSTLPNAGCPLRRSQSTPATLRGGHPRPTSHSQYSVRCSPGHRFGEEVARASGSGPLSSGTIAAGGSVPSSVAIDGGGGPRASH